MVFKFRGARYKWGTQRYHESVLRDRTLHYTSTDHHFTMLHTVLSNGGGQQSKTARSVGSTPKNGAGYVMIRQNMKTCQHQEDSYATIDLSLTAYYVAPS
jgi:hypothetical protein